MTRANNWRSIGRISWRMASFRSFNYGVCERKHAISNPPQITRWKLGRARGPRHVSETGNEVPEKHVSNNGHWLVCSVRCGTILLKPHIDTVPPPGLPTEHYPFKRCQVPVGHIVYVHICYFLVTDYCTWCKTKVCDFCHMRCFSDGNCRHS